MAVLWSAHLGRVSTVQTSWRMPSARLMRARAPAPSFTSSSVEGTKSSKTITSSRNTSRPRTESQVTFALVWVCGQTMKGWTCGRSSQVCQGLLTYGTSPWEGSWIEVTHTRTRSTTFATLDREASLFQQISKVGCSKEGSHCTLKSQLSGRQKSVCQSSMPSTEESLHSVSMTN